MGDIIDSALMHINKGNAHGTQGNAPKRLNFADSILLKQHAITANRQQSRKASYIGKSIFGSIGSER